MLNDKILDFIKKNKYVDVFFEDERVYMFYDSNGRIPIRFLIEEWYTTRDFVGALYEGKLYNEQESLKLLDMKAFW